MHLVPSLAVFCACGTRKFSEWAPRAFSLLPLLSLLSKRVKITFSSYFLSFLLLSSYFLLKQTDCKCTTHSPQIRFKLKPKPKSRHHHLRHPTASIKPRGKFQKSPPSLPDLAVSLPGTREIDTIRRIKYHEKINGE